MAIGGFPEVNEDKGSRVTFEPWFQSADGTIISIAENVPNGNIIVELADSSVFTIGDTVWIDTPVYPNLYGTVVSIPASDEIQLDITYTADDALGGFWANVENITTFEIETPEDLFREIHIQFEVSELQLVEVTFNGIDYHPTNNNVNFLGLNTISLSVKKDVILNFRGVSLATYELKALLMAA